MRILLTEDNFIVGKSIKQILKNIITALRLPLILSHFSFVEKKYNSRFFVVQILLKLNHWNCSKYELFFNDLINFFKIYEA
jgi:hypothetical protein